MENDFHLQKLAEDSRLLDQISNQLCTPRHLVSIKVDEMIAELEELRSLLAEFTKK